MKKILSLTILAVMVALGARGAWADGPYPTAIGGTGTVESGVVTPNDTTGEFEIYMAVNTLLGGPPTFANNAALDPMEVTGNTSVWTQVGTSGYTVIGLGAADNNTLDVYTPTATKPTTGQLISPFNETFTGTSPTAFEGNGTSTSPYPGVPGVYTSGTEFGFALNQNNLGTIFYSNPAFNSDSMDHLVVYNLTDLVGKTIYITDPNTGDTTTEVLTDPYLLAWEDTAELSATSGAPSDLDYNDLMVLVNGVSPLPSGSGAPVPEPMTGALLSMGLLGMAGFALRRSKFSMIS